MSTLRDLANAFWRLRASLFRRALTRRRGGLTRTGKTWALTRFGLRFCSDPGRGGGGKSSIGILLLGGVMKPGRVTFRVRCLQVEYFCLKIATYAADKAVLLILQTGSFLVRDGRKTGAFFSKNTGVRRAKRRAKFKFRPSFGAFSYLTAPSERY